MRKYDPKVVIPSHYFIKGLTTDISGLVSADAWVNDQEKKHHADVVRLSRADLTLNPAKLKESRHRIYYFDHFENKHDTVSQGRSASRLGGHYGGARSRFFDAKE